jgi:hypothetical protein
MSTDDRPVAAHHEAGHAVVGYVASGVPPELTSIVPNDEALGRVSHEAYVLTNPEHAEARILSAYAGAHAARQLDPTLDPTLVGDGAKTMTSAPPSYCRTGDGRTARRSYASALWR